jgi:alpha-glucosidase (family GH31 glycosyl hydrolase)
MVLRLSLAAVALLSLIPVTQAAPLVAGGKPARLEIRAAGDHAVRITLQPQDAKTPFPYTPALAEHNYGAPVIKLEDIGEPVQAEVGKLKVEVRGEPLTVTVSDGGGRVLQTLEFAADGIMTFVTDDQPILGMGEGGPLPHDRNWRDDDIQFNRNGIADDMRPRWQGTAYGSRNPVALLVGTSGWGMYVATPWGAFDMREAGHGKFTPWTPPAPLEDAPEGQGRRQRQQARGARIAQVQGRPPEDSLVPGAFDVFVFDAKNPAAFMNDVATIAGRAVMPPKWSLGYMQSHRTLRDDKQLTEIVDTFREKKIPVDSVVYLGTGFCPKGWNERQPSYKFNPELFVDRKPEEVIAALHDNHVKVIVHVVPFGREGLATIQGTIPAKDGEPDDNTHIANYWKEYHEPLFTAGVDAFWPDEGDRFSIFERMTRVKMYYQGHLMTTPNVRPWTLNRNGVIGMARWGAWLWSGDTQSRWNTLRDQIWIGLNTGLSVTPYWGSDTGGFYTTNELTGELYARWYQFSAFNGSFRSHGRIWRLRTPWGWGLDEMGFAEGQTALPPKQEMNNQAIEPVAKKYTELRYQLMPYTYTLAREAYDTGMPLMRALWLHYPSDKQALGQSQEYLWGRDMLIAPVYEKGAASRDVYLPAGTWYD